MYVTMFIIISLFLLSIIGIGITLVIMNNNNLNKINDSTSDTVDITLMESKYIVSAETFGNSVSLEYDSNKRYKTINLYGNFNDVENKIPNISLAFSDTGKNWNVSGDTEIASLQKVHNNRYDFMLQISNAAFKYTTVYISGQVDNISCYIKLSK